ERGRGCVADICRHWLVEQLENIHQRRLSADRDRPVAVELLHQREDSLRAERQCAQYWKSSANSARLSTHDDGKSGYQNHSERFHSVARSLIQIHAVTDCRLQLENGALVNPAVHLLRA